MAYGEDEPEPERRGWYFRGNSISCSKEAIFCNANFYIRVADFY